MTNILLYVRVGVIGDLSMVPTASARAPCGQSLCEFVCLCVARACRQLLSRVHPYRAAYNTVPLALRSYGRSRPRMRGRSIEAIDDMHVHVPQDRKNLPGSWVYFSAPASSAPSPRRKEGGAMRCLEWCALCSPSFESLSRDSARRRTSSLICHLRRCSCDAVCVVVGAEKRKFA